MTWTDWACLGVVVIGIVLFLYGANYYDAIVGWIGVYLFVGGIVAFLAIYIYNELTKKPEPQNP
jgi:divalent metal cation (Fe/Co/Zn/Cd) transporter